jgi:hypothetical protein
MAAKTAKWRMKSKWHRNETIMAIWQNNAMAAAGMAKAQWRNEMSK